LRNVVELVDGVVSFGMAFASTGDHDDALERTRAKEEAAGSIRTSVELRDGLEVPVYEGALRPEERAGYATRLWDCSVGMARWIAAEQTASRGGASSCPLAGWRVLELGAGTGLCALAVAVTTQAAEISATDVDPAAVSLTSLAAAELGCAALSAAVFDVCGEAALPRCELLLVSDLMYTEHLALALTRRCCEALERGARVIVGCGGRPARAKFLESLADAGINAHFHSADAVSFAEWAEDCGTTRLLLLDMENDLRLFGVSSSPVMF